MTPLALVHAQAMASEFTGLAKFN